MKINLKKKKKKYKLSTELECLCCDYRFFYKARYCFAAYIPR